MSGRIRTLKPEWLEDGRLAMSSSDARVLSAALILLADDYGNGRADLTILAGRVFPGKDIEVTSYALRDLVAIKYVLLYERDEQHYFSIRNWAKHQRVDNAGKPRVPGPLGSDETSSRNFAEFLRDSPLDLDHDHDHDHDHEAPAPQARAGSTRRVGKPLPLDAEWLPPDELVEALAAKHSVDPGRIRQVLPEFRWYWRSGKGAGKARGEKGWQQSFANRISQMARTDELYRLNGQLAETKSGAIKWSE